MKLVLPLSKNDRVLLPDSLPKSNSFSHLAPTPAPSSPTESRATRSPKHSLILGCDFVSRHDDS